MMDLKPCPFCGKEAEIERLGTPRQSTIYQCGWCAATLETGEEWGHGTAWNTRPREDALQAEVERLRGLLNFAADRIEDGIPVTGPTLANDLREGINRAAFKGAPHE